VPTHPGRGILIAIEGIDGAGKTTQVNLLADVLRKVGLSVTTSKEPTDGKWGTKIRETANGKRMPVEQELEAFINDRTEHVETLVWPSLQRGDVVILDRYYYSTLAYQGSRGADVKAVQDQMEGLFPIPDAVFLLDIDPALSLYRITQTRGDNANSFEKRTSLVKARQTFNSLQESRIHKIDGSVSIEAVFGEIMAAFVDGPLKDRRCAKSYGCDDPFHCTFQSTNTCEWLNLARQLSPSTVQETQTA
jgi:dTMP kinase